MSWIPNISLTEKQVRNILSHDRVCVGGEAVICESGQYNTLYKLFTNITNLNQWEKTKKKDNRII